MENNRYAQINYNPDDLDDVSITEVECQKETFSKESSTKTDVLETDILESIQGFEEVVSQEMKMEEKDMQEETEDEESENQESSQELDEPRETTEPIEKETEDEEMKSWNKSEELKAIADRYEEMNEDIQRTLRRLEKKFNEEILNGENRDSAVKTMYKELNEYKAGIVEKALKNVLYDIIDIREMMLSQIRFLREKKGQDTISLEEFESYANDIGDILEKHDVTIYKGKTGEENIAVKQKIVRKVETEDDALVKKIAESLSYGYEYGSKILYPEKISVYIKKK